MLAALTLAAWCTYAGTAAAIIDTHRARERARPRRTVTLTRR